MGQGLFPSSVKGLLSLIAASYGSISAVSSMVHPNIISTYGSLPKLGVPLGASIIRIIVYWGLHWGPPI